MQSPNNVAAELPNETTEFWGFKIIGSDEGLPLVSRFETPAPRSEKRFIVSNTHGLFVAAGSNGIIAGKLEDLRSAATNEAPEGVQKHEFKNTGGRVRHLEFSADESHIAVVSADDGNDVYIYSMGKVMEQGSLEDFECHIQGDSPILDIQCRPETSNEFTILEESGELKRLQTVNSEISKMASGVTITSWSPRGKQALVGFKDGSIKQLHPDGTTFCLFNKLTDIDDNFYPVALSWLQAHTFLVVYSNDDDGDVAPYMCQRDKASNVATWNKITEISFPLEPQNGWWYPTVLRDWSQELPFVITVGMSGSSDITLMTEKTSFTMSEDTDRANLPFTEDDTFPVGIALDISSAEKVKAPCMGVDESNPLPIVWVLNNEGSVCAWNIVNKEKTKDGSTTLEKAKETYNTRVERARNNEVLSYVPPSSSGGTPAAKSSTADTARTSTATSALSGSGSFGQFSSGSFGNTSSSFGVSNTAKFGQHGFGQSPSSNNNNTGFGQHGFGQNTSSNNNTSFGQHGFGQNTSSNNNTSFGQHGFGQSPSSSNNNTGFGQHGFGQNTSSNNNTGFGQHGFGQNTSSNNNTGFGQHGFGKDTSSSSAASGANQAFGQHSFGQNPNSNLFGGVSSNASAFGQSTFGKSSNSSSQFGAFDKPETQTNVFATLGKEVQEDEEETSNNDIPSKGASIFDQSTEIGSQKQDIPSVVKPENADTNSLNLGNLNLPEVPKNANRFKPNSDGNISSDEGSLSSDNEEEDEDDYAVVSRNEVPETSKNNDLAASIGSMSFGGSSQSHSDLGSKKNSDFTANIEKMSFGGLSQSYSQNTHFSFGQKGLSDETEEKKANNETENKDSLSADKNVINFTQETKAAEDSGDGRISAEIDSVLQESKDKGLDDEEKGSKEQDSNYSKEQEPTEAYTPKEASTEDSLDQTRKEEENVSSKETATKETEKSNDATSPAPSKPLTDVSYTTQLDSPKNKLTELKEEDNSEQPSGFDKTSLNASFAPDKQTYPPSTHENFDVGKFQSQEADKLSSLDERRAVDLSKPSTSDEGYEELSTPAEYGEDEEKSVYDDEESWEDEEGWEDENDDNEAKAGSDNKTASYKQQDNTEVFEEEEEPQDEFDDESESTPEPDYNKVPDFPDFIPTSEAMVPEEGSELRSLYDQYYLETEEQFKIMQMNSRNMGNYIDWHSFENETGGPSEVEDVWLREKWRLSDSSSVSYLADRLFSQLSKYQEDTKGDDEKIEELKKSLTSVALQLSRAQELVRYKSGEVSKRALELRSLPVNAVELQRQLRKKTTQVEENIGKIESEVNVLKSRLSRFGSSNAPSLLGIRESIDKITELAYKKAERVEELRRELQPTNQARRKIATSSSNNSMSTPVKARPSDYGSHSISGATPGSVVNREAMIDEVDFLSKQSQSKFKKSVGDWLRKRKQEDVLKNNRVEGTQ